MVRRGGITLLIYSIFPKEGVIPTGQAGAQTLAFESLLGEKGTVHLRAENVAATEKLGLSL